MLVNEFTQPGDVVYQPATAPTLRDQFAMAALTSLLRIEGYMMRDRSRIAYEYADAMLKARSVEQTEE